MKSENGERLFGMIYNGLLTKGFGEVRWASVLGRIGLAWMLAAFLYMAFPCRTRIVIAVGFLVGYCLAARVARLRQQGYLGASAYCT